MKERRNRSERDSDGPRERRPGRRDRDSDRSGGRSPRRFGNSDGPRERRSDKRSQRRFGDRDSEVEMTSVICDKCGKECEVPFKPTSSKPIFCSECFRQNKGSGRSGGRESRMSDRRSGPSSDDIDKINKKLDKIMKALKISE